jgi:hypothetical protein
MEANTGSRASPHWRVLYEAAVLEIDAEKLPQRIAQAQSAIMDRVEDLNHSCDGSESKALIDALNVCVTFAKWRILTAKHKIPVTPTIFPFLRARAKHMFPKNNPDLAVAFVDCPYCDGENAITKTGLLPSQGEFQDREVACQHCTSLFLLSESKKGVRTRRPNVQLNSESVVVKPEIAAEQMKREAAQVSRPTERVE